MKNTYHPITKPLIQLIETIERKEPIISKFQVSTPKKENRSTYLSQIKQQKVTPEKLYERPLTETVYETGHDNDDSLPVTSDSTTQHFIDESIRQFAGITRGEYAAFQEYLSQYDDLPRLYIKESIRNTEGAFDHRFRVRRDIELDKFSIGPLVNPLGFTKKDEQEY